MGKGTGKLSIWFTQLPAGTILLETRNLRAGRAKYFLQQTAAKLPVPSTVIVTRVRGFTWPRTARLATSSPMFF